MADSDNTTSLPFVTHRRRDKISACGGRMPVSHGAISGGITGEATDPVLTLAANWQSSHLNVLTLCERQQKLESHELGLAGVSGSSSRNSASRAEGRCGGEVEGAYAAAKLAEEQAVETAGEIFEELFRTPAQSMAGVIAKLEAVLLESEVCDGPNDFPWPHIRSVLADLKRCGASGATVAAPLED